MAKKNILKRHKNFKDLTGQKFGRLTVLWPTAERSGSSVVWECLCDCGDFCKVSSWNLTNGLTQSCGCLFKERITKHGMVGTRIYNVWRNMMRRCYGVNYTSYKNYGGRGIKVCERWRGPEGFKNFFADVGDIPESKTFDRYPDNDGNYDLNNWRWATLKEQANNRRPNSSSHNKQKWFVALDQKTGVCFKSNNQSEFAKQFGLSVSCISECLSGKVKETKSWAFKRIGT